jgi:hypothetical protein
MGATSRGGTDYHSLFVLLTLFSFGHSIVCLSSIYGFWFHSNTVGVMKEAGLVYPSRTTVFTSDCKWVPCCPSVWVLRYKTKTNKTGDTRNIEHTRYKTKTNKTGDTRNIEHTRYKTNVCLLFVCLRLVSYVLNVTCVSEFFIFDCSFGFLKYKYDVICSYSYLN